MRSSIERSMVRAAGVEIGLSTQTNMLHLRIFGISRGKPNVPCFAGSDIQWLLAADFLAGI